MPVLNNLMTHWHFPVVMNTQNKILYGFLESNLIIFTDNKQVIPGLVLHAEIMPILELLTDSCVYVCDV